ncbi:MAG: serine/threonine protein kinase [Deltaproteobacteria bacterium]|nr:serine/threonine protein kinase [Deltaproteobacteria bacterium]
MGSTIKIPELAANTIVGGSYRIIRKIGSGGMSVVYEAENLRLPELRVAVKIIKSNYASDDEFYQRFRREAAIGARVRHPNVAAVIDWNAMPDGTPFLVMEYLEGESLHERMKRGPLSKELVRSVLFQTAAALEVAHAQSVIHRDLKPRNIFLISGSANLPEGILVKVIDFGVSKILGADTLESTTSRTLGTPRYMSPEQISTDHQRVGPATDQFSLGALAYELIAGKPAFNGDCLETVLYQIVNEDPLPLHELAPHVSPRLEHAINRALSKKPAERYPSISAFVREAFRDDLESTTPTVAVKLKNKLKLRKKLQQLTIAVLMLTTVALLISFAIITMQNDSAEFVFAEPKDEVTAFNVNNEPAPFTPQANQQVIHFSVPSNNNITRDTNEDIEDTNLLKIPNLATAQAKLTEAQNLDFTGNYLESIRVARQSIALEDSNTARMLIFLGYCSLNDVGNARAAFFAINKKAHTQARRLCKERGLDF